MLPRVLPDLTNNILCGNSLVGWDINANDELFPEEEVSINPFDFQSSFPNVFKKGGFDAIIGNPPYVKEYTDRSVFEHVRKSYLAKYYQGKMDLWYFFVCNGLDLLKSYGLLGYIAPNNWTTNTGASIMRNKIINDSQIIEMMDFGNYMVFDEASIQTINIILYKNKKKNNYNTLYGKLINHDDTQTSALELLSHRKSKNNIILNPKIVRINFIDQYILFGNS